MKYLALTALAGFLALPVAGQKNQPKSAPAKAAQTKPEAESNAAMTEDEALQEGLRQAGGTPIEYARALERHLKVYPQSPRRAEIESVLGQAAVDLKDPARILRYTVPAVDSGATSATMIDAAASALLVRNKDGDADKAAAFAKRLFGVYSDQRAQLIAAPQKMARGRALDDLEFKLAKAKLLEARALRLSGKPADALKVLDEGWAIAPEEELAREKSLILASEGKKAEAAAALGDAIVAGGLEIAANKDREALSKLAGPESARILFDAWTRGSETVQSRRKRISAVDPNFTARQVGDYTLTALEGEPVKIDSLKGKVVVLDFWATWCGPCRAQHPLYEKVKERFAGNDRVLFLNVSTDEDRSIVPGFLDANKWSRRVYFDDGLGLHLRISSIPTTVVLDPRGAITSRMQGFNPDLFVDMLTLRIKEALAEGE